MKVFETEELLFILKNNVLNMTLTPLHYQTLDNSLNIQFHVDPFQFVNFLY
jgi:hypothetical protein